MRRPAPKVPFLDLAAAQAELRPRLDEAYSRVMGSGRYVLGPEVTAFEREFAAFCGVRHCIGVGTGLDALELLLRGYGIGPGDEVLVPSNTFIATWLAVTRAGATPVPVEPDPATFNMDPDNVAAAVTPRTKAIMPVDLYGLPAAMAPLREEAERLDLHLVEDAAQAHGADIDGRRTGSLGHAAGFSFYPGKNLGAFGDAGCITTDDTELAERVRLLGNYGSPRKYEHPVQGTNSRLDELQAAFLRVRLATLLEWNVRRAAIAKRYLHDLVGTGLGLPSEPPGLRSAWHLFVVTSARRDALQQRLAAQGIETLVHYPKPPHLQGAYLGRGLRAGALPVAERLAAQVLSIPIGPHLSDEQAAHVTEAIRQAER